MTIERFEEMLRTFYPEYNFIVMDNVNNLNVYNSVTVKTVSVSKDYVEKLTEDVFMIAMCLHTMQELFAENDLES